MKKRDDILARALAQLQQEGLASNVPQEVLDETMRRLADAQAAAEPARNLVPLGSRENGNSGRTAFIRLSLKLATAAAVLLFVGYAAGRLSAPRPPDLEQLREALAPSLAASLEPAIRERVVEDLRPQYQLALAGTYVRVKEELTEQYRNDLNRFAVQTLAASNAVTNELLTQLIQSMDTAKAQDLRRIAQALYEIEHNRVQDRTQLASGLQTLAYHTENELTRTRRQVAQFLGDTRLEGLDEPAGQPKHIYDERSEP
jgi:hypothetical protein